MLADYKNDFFATHSDMTKALNYVNDLCSTADSTNSLAIRTAAQIILNTAIDMHKAEKQVLVDKINEMSARANPVTALLSLVREQVAAEVKAQTHTISAELHNQIDSQIENWVSDNFADHADDWYGNNVDIGEAIDQHIERHLNLEDDVATKINEFFDNHTFTLNPR
jgi:DNA polymerase III gamma/tau subunit